MVSEAHYHYYLDLIIELALMPLEKIVSSHTSHQVLVNSNFHQSMSHVTQCGELNDLVQYAILVGCLVLC